MKDTTPFLIDRATGIRAALKHLDRNAKGILFVIDSSGILVGSLTDGDVRRWILAEGALDEQADKVCNANPQFVLESFDIETVRRMMTEAKIDCIPVLDRERHIVDLLFTDDAFGETASVRPKRALDIPVVIMAGGKGSRLAPFTHILPKPLIPIGDKTVLELIIAKFLEHQVGRFSLCVHHKSKIIISYLEELNPPYSIDYSFEDKPLGTAGGLKHLRDRIGDRFLVTNCDIIIDADFPEIAAFHEQAKNEITVVASLKGFSIPYGVCEISNGGSLTKIDEKPELTFLVNTGMYILETRVLDLIPSDEPFDMTDLIAAVKKGGGKVGVFPIHENSWIDVGEWGSYKKAVEVLSL